MLPDFDFPDDTKSCIVVLISLSPRFCCETLSKFECNHDTRRLFSGSDDVVGNWDERRSSVDTIGLVSCDLGIFKDVLLGFGVKFEPADALGLMIRRFAFGFKLKLSSIELSNSSKPPNKDFCDGTDNQSQRMKYKFKLYDFFQLNCFENIVFNIVLTFDKVEVTGFTFNPFETFGDILY